MEELRPRSRRAVLAAGAGAIAAFVGQALGRPSRAIAATGDPLVLGSLVNSTPDPTRLTSNVFGVVLDVQHTGIGGNAIFASSQGTSGADAAIQATAGGGAPGILAGASTGGALGSPGAGARTAAVPGRARVS